MLRLHQKHRNQITFLDEFLPPDLRCLPEELAKLDRWLDDERFFRQRLGRPSIPAETYLRMMALKHQYGLSDRQVCALVDDRKGFTDEGHVLMASYGPAANAYHLCLLTKKPEVQLSWLSTAIMTHQVC